MKKEKGENVQVRPSVRHWLKVTSAKADIKVVDLMSALLERYMINESEALKVAEEWKEKNE